MNSNLEKLLNGGERMLINEVFKKFCESGCPDRDNCSYQGLRNAKCAVWHFKEILQLSIHRRLK